MKLAHVIFKKSCLGARYVAILGPIALLVSFILLGSFGTGIVSAQEPVSLDPHPPIIYQPISGPGLSPDIVSGAFTPANIRAAYNFGSLASSSDMHIAIIDAYGDPTLAADVSNFDSTFSLPTITLNTYNVDGNPGSNSSWAIETALDVEWAHACAPNATIDLIIAVDNSYTHLLDAINKAVSLKTVNSYNVVVISMSFGGSESSTTPYSQWEAAFTSARAAGIQLVVSSGDGGAYDGTSPQQLTVEYPASSPQVISVGGTSLTLSAGIYGSETAWSSSGGGYSTHFSEPSFQSSAAIHDTASMRGVPDISLDADPNTGVNVLMGGTWYQVGGTSLSAPIWAAIIADSATVNPGSPITLNSLYGIYGAGGSGSNYLTDFHDVTSGNNGYYSAANGWDAATGIGTPNVTNLLPLFISTSALSGDVGVPFNQSLIAYQGTPPYTWSITSGILPDGLSLNPATGAITGTPTTSGGPTQITFQVTDSIGATASKPVSITINVQPSITTASPLPGGELTVAYSQTPVVTGGSSPFIWSVSAGSLPTGLSLNTSTGAISGTPTSVSNPTFTIMVTDSAGGTGTKVFTLNIIAGPTISTTSPLPGGEVTAAYSSTLTGAGGSGVYTGWAVSSGSLPAGLTLHAATGVIDGTPTSVSNPSFTIRVTDSAGGTGTKTFTLRIIAAPSITTTSPLTGGEVTAPYSKTVVASGGSGTFTNWIVSVGSLPAGLTLNSGTGVISGTPTTVSNPSFTIRVTDSAGGYGTKAFTLNIIAAPRITSSAPPSGWDQNLLFTPYTVTGSGGTGTRTFSATGLPAGLVINSSSGVISGTPTTINNYSSCVITVTDGIGGTGTQNAPTNIVAKPGITSLAPPASWDQNLLFTPFTVTASGGTGTLTFSVVNLPSGLSLNSTTGAISGTPTTINNYSSCVITVTDAIGGTGTQNAPMNIVAKPGITSAAPPAAWDQNLLFTSFTVTATGGTGARTFSASGLPTGLAINSSTGVISGTPTALGSFNSGIVMVTDSIGGTGTQAFSIIINPLPSITTTSPLANGKVGIVYSQTLGVTGGSATFTWSITAGALPTGLTLNLSSGAITGNPTTTVVSSNITFRVVDSVGGSVSKILAITVKASAVADYDGDGKTDIGIFRPSTSSWYIFKSNGSGGLSYNWGASGDIPVTGDFDGDGKADIGIFRPSTGSWYILLSGGGSSSYNWGASGDIPVTGDYDGDGKADIGVFRPSTGSWYILLSGGGSSSYNWGASGDIPVTGDYDGDGKADIGIFRPSTGSWYILLSGGGSSSYNWGASGDIPVTGDYDGDGKADIGIFRPSTGSWYILLSGGGSSSYNWGASGDIPVTGDYDGDGKADIGVFRPSTGSWYILKSNGSGGLSQNWGISGDTPLPSLVQ